ncbi:hypothetical protein GOV04_04570 [Candidatus Woesearchaeota archaeon]|nr:hypothetical protein [Candidatus Woesearchaeota archaeon]
MKKKRSHKSHVDSVLVTSLFRNLFLIIGVFFSLLVFFNAPFLVHYIGLVLTSAFLFFVIGLLVDKLIFRVRQLDALVSVGLILSVLIVGIILLIIVASVYSGDCVFAQVQAKNIFSGQCKTFASSCKPWYYQLSEYCN